MYEAVKLPEPPVERGILILIPYAVEPDGSHGPVLREQLGELRLHEGEVGVGILLFGIAARAAPGPPARGILPPPVDERVVEVYAEPLPVALLGQFTHHVARKGRGLHDVVGRLGRAEHRESVVVARCEADVAGPRLAKCRNPFPGVEPCRVECSGELRIFVAVDVEVGHHPFALPEQGIETPVDEDSETGVGELPPCGDVFGSRHIPRLCCGAYGEQGGTAAEKEFFHADLGICFPKIRKGSENPPPGFGISFFCRSAPRTTCRRESLRHPPWLRG